MKKIEKSLVLGLLLASIGCGPPPCSGSVFYVYTDFLAKKYHKIYDDMFNNHQPEAEYTESYDFEFVNKELNNKLKYSCQHAGELRNECYFSAARVAEIYELGFSRGVNEIVLYSRKEKLKPKLFKQLAPTGEEKISVDFYNSMCNP